MGHMSNSGKFAIGAFLAALALLALAGVTLHETVFLWFLAAAGAAYVACVSEVVIRRRHRTLAASGIGSMLFIAFGIAFLRQWGLAFNADPDAMSAPVDSDHPDLYFYLAAAAGAATLLLLVAGTVLPGRGRRPRPRGSVPGRRPAAARGTASKAPASRRAPSRTASPRPAPRSAAPPARAPAPRPAVPGARRPAPSAGRTTGTKSVAKGPAKSVERTSARSSTRR